LDVKPDFKVTSVDNDHQHIEYIHRQTETAEIYFVTNGSLTQEKVTCTFRVDKDLVPELWDAETGMIQRNVAYSKVENGISIDLVLDPIASRFVVFKDQSSGKNDAGLRTDLQFGFSKNGERSNKIDLTKNWNVSFDTEMGGPESYQMEQLTSWSDINLDGVKYYSGTATYTREFSIEEALLSKDTEVYVAFEGIQEMARFFINGNDVGILWTPPYQANITQHLKPGTNQITVEVINTWNNRIVGDLRNPDKTPYTHTNAKSKFTKDGPLLPSGLTGKAALLFVNTNQ